jgi:hypothetical protein
MRISWHFRAISIDFVDLRALLSDLGILEMQYLMHKPSVLVLILSVSACAQGISTSELKGTIEDTTGAAVEGAHVLVRQATTGVLRSVTSGRSGVYQFLALPIGEYELEVSKPEFAAYSRTGIVLQVASNPTLDVTLTLASRSERVTVEADAVMVETRVTGVGQVIDSRRILDLPLTWRSSAIFGTESDFSARVRANRKPRREVHCRDAQQPRRDTVINKRRPKRPRGAAVATGRGEGGETAIPTRAWAQAHSGRSRPPPRTSQFAHFVIAYSRDNRAHLIYPGGVSKDDWLYDLTLLTQ